MSIISLSDGLTSDFTAKHLKELVAQLSIDISDSKDSDDYLRLLWSLEGVMKHIDDSPDYIHPALKPQPVSTSRNFWRPSSEDNPFNAWSHICDLRATNPISSALKGRTVAIKDNISVGGLPTTLGAPPSLLSEKAVYPTSPIDATVVSRLLGAGAVIKGTSTCECFCASPLSFTSATGPVHNPRLHGYTAGGSSSGSCALVAAHVLASERNGGLGKTVELAIGSDQAGSVRIPASYNGIYGLKPTFGLIPYTGAASMSPMIDHLGPIASRLEDIAGLIEVMAGYDGLDPRMTPESPLINRVKPYSQLLAAFRQQLKSKPEAGRTWRIGLLIESFQIPGIAPEVRDTVRKAASEFFKAAGATVVDISVPIHRDGPIIWTASTRPSMSSWLCQGKPSGHLSYLSPHIQPIWPPTQDTYEIITASNPALTNIMLSEQFSQRFISAGTEAKAHRKVFELRDAYDKALEEVDVLVTPCAPTIAMPHPRSVDSQGRSLSILERLEHSIGLTSNTCPFNVTGHPALNVPCGFSNPPGRSEISLPIGMQIIGRRWCDEQVIMAAALFEMGRELASQ
ncbi:amidase signature domain-containing protein [Talaromyces proteolyticus]|uniref:Amidase signature domain-containing protein n=1 Tax=Talaromyces proteolyticus TaxID=1131652 RepID=A0AAD4KLX4_9EURO|nr:amidase signature domain-containing protein [Talaromyces proteolyticus]KAH8691497.1 amidase signature domain-containing protein [Talaromyces proteolyticus]